MAKRTISDRLDAIEAALVPRITEAEIRKTMEDVLNTLNLVGQLTEVETNQRDQLAMLVGLAAELLAESRTNERTRVAAALIASEASDKALAVVEEHANSSDAHAATAGAHTEDQTTEIMMLLIQLRELGRKHVAGLYDLERTIDTVREIAL